MTSSSSIAAVLAFAFTICGVGCAGFTAKPVTSDVQDSQEDGVRYYEIAPYLLVYSDGNGNLNSRIEMMPDTSRKMVMDLHAFASKNNSTLTFENGVLVSSNFVLDNTAIPTQLIESIKTLGTAAIANAFNEPGAGTVRRIPPPYLFKIVVDSDGTRLVGGPGEDAHGKAMVINVTVTREAATSAAEGGTR
jgi:hypothetical protein